jgi:hypothetical protein
MGPGMIYVPLREIKAGQIVDNMWRATDAGGCLLYGKPFLKVAITHPPRIPSHSRCLFSVRNFHKYWLILWLTAVDRFYRTGDAALAAFPDAYAVLGRTSQHAQDNSNTQCG